MQYYHIYILHIQPFSFAICSACNAGCPLHTRTHACEQVHSPKTRILSCRCATSAGCASDLLLPATKYYNLRVFFTAIFVITFCSTSARRRIHSTLSHTHTHITFSWRTPQKVCVFSSVSVNFFFASLIWNYKIELKFSHFDSIVDIYNFSYRCAAIFSYTFFFFLFIFYELWIYVKPHRNSKRREINRVNEASEQKKKCEFFILQFVGNLFCVHLLYFLLDP